MFNLKINSVFLKIKCKLKQRKKKLFKSKKVWKCRFKGIEDQGAANETADKHEESKNKRLKSAKNAIIAPADDVESQWPKIVVVPVPAASSTRMENSDGIGRKKEIPTGGPQQRATFRRFSARPPTAAGDKKLGNVLRPVTSSTSTLRSTTPLGLTGKNKRPASYLELYCRRFSETDSFFSSSIAALLNSIPPFPLYFTASLSSLFVSASCSSSRSFLFISKIYSLLPMLTFSYHSKL